MDFMLNFPMFASILLVFLIVVKVLWPQKGKSTNKRVPCPPAYPIIGHLHLMAQNPTDPWKTFDSFRQQYGDIVSLRLGMWNAVLISSFDVIKEVLLTRGDEFADRPTFHRYSIIFSGDRNNALALCDWSELQKIRRSVSQLTTMPNTLGCQHQKLVDSIDSEMKIFLDQLDGDSIVLTKSDALQYVTNVFTEYMCSVRFEYNDETLVKQAYNYDYVFYDINQCYLIDFLPFLRYFGVSRGYLNNLNNVCDDLRDFVAEEFIEPRVRVILESKKNDDNKRIGKESLSIDDSETFVDYIIKFHLENKDLMSWDHMLFVIGDLLGGSSAVANIIWRMLGNLALDMNVQEILYDEVERVYKSSQNDLITLEDRKQLSYLDAVFLEALRFASSPIVPHVPSQDSTIAGYDIPKGTMVMFNNYHLNNSTEFWESPEKFDPKHFLTQVTDQDGTLNNRVKKPDVFIPFSFGKRSCLGLKLTKYIAMITVANIILKYEVHPVNANDAKDMQDQLSQRMLALKVDDCYSLKLIPRES